MRLSSGNKVIVMGWGVHNCGTVALMVFSQFSDICGPVGLMVLGQFSDIFGPFYWWRKREYLEKTTDLCHESLTNYHPTWYHVHPP